MAKTKSLILIFFMSVTLLLMTGCQQKAKNTTSLPNSPEITKASLEILYKGLGCNSPDECAKFCEANHEVCDKFCSENPGICPEILKPEHSEKPEGAGGPLASTECANPTLIAKMKAVVDNALVNPPAKIESLNWMTKILPSSNPYPGYYYDISTAFGPAIDEIIKQNIQWSGNGEPPMASGKFHYSFGYWDDTPKGKEATLGDETPDTIDFSKYKLAIFYTDYTGSQDKMINSLPSLSMSESQAKDFFYSVFKKSFMNLDQRQLAKKGDRFYEAQWKDSEKTSDYWDVQIGEGYIAIGQGKVYSDESALAGNVGTIWIYHGCKPCMECDDWTKGKELNRDCVSDADCKSGLACSGGYCVKRTSEVKQSAQGGVGGPGSPCSTLNDCGSGLICKNSVCSIPK
jgi:hypothetical protein